MALDRTTIWICDVCGTKETIVSTDDTKGLNTPFWWDEKTITMSYTKDETYSRRVLMCVDCINDFKRLYSFKEESKEPLKKSFWQNMFGKTKVDGAK